MSARTREFGVRVAIGAGTAVLASLMPAARASRVDVLRALRSESLAGSGLIDPSRVAIVVLDGGGYVGSVIILVVLALAAAGPVRPLGQGSHAASPPGYTTTRTGDVHDFDYFAGGWTTRQRRLKARGVGSDEWEEFPATLCMSLYLGGVATVDELYFPTKGWAGRTLRTFDRERRQWSIYWVSGATGKLDPPVVGGFDGPAARSGSGPRRIRLRRPGAAHGRPRFEEPARRYGLIW